MSRSIWAVSASRSPAGKRNSGEMANCGVALSGESAMTHGSPQAMASRTDMHSTSTSAAWMSRSAPP